MDINEDVLEGAGVISMDSPNHSGELTPDTIIIHFTAGGSGESSAKYLCSSQAQASAHLVVGRDGSVYQLVPFNKVAWHAGSSSYIFPDGERRAGFNNSSIGIEIDNAGNLEKCGDQYKSWFGRLYTAGEVFEGIHRNETSPRYWHTYTEKQIEAVQEICSLLINEYGIKHILGHEEVAPGRKLDPGPAFPLDTMRELLLSSSRHEVTAHEPEKTKGSVDCDYLNIRIQPSDTGDRVALPLRGGQEVEIQAEEGEWYHVKTTIEGWVKKEFINEEKKI